MFTRTVALLFNQSRKIHSMQIDLKKVGIIGVPFDKGQKKLGVQEGPKAMRSGELIQAIQEISDTYNIKDYGDISYTVPDAHIRKPPNMLQLEHVSSCNLKLSNKVYEILSDNRFCITLGGDHAIGVGTIDGHYRYNPNMAVIWIDAHADLNTSATSPSGNVHGMSVALLVKELSDYWPYLPGMDWQKPNPVNMIANEIPLSKYNKKIFFSNNYNPKFKF